MVLSSSHLEFFSFQSKKCVTFLVHNFRLQNEIDNTIGEKSVIEYEDLTKLNYLDMVVKETLRLYPPVPVTSRALRQKTVIGGYDIPAGADVLVMYIYINCLYMFPVFTL